MVCIEQIREHVFSKSDYIAYVSTVRASASAYPAHTCAHAYASQRYTIFR